MKILIVDDSILTLTLARDELQAAGHEVIARDHPIGSGVAILREQPNMVLVDVTMPALSGQDVVALLRKNPSLNRTKIILFSDRSDSDLRDIVRACGADGYIRKQPGLRNLVQEAEALLAEARPAAEITTEATMSDDVLVFVDADANLKHYRRAFCDFPCTAFVRTGAEALNVIQATACSAVICGTSLPDTTAEDLYARAVAVDPRWRRRFVLAVERGDAESRPDGPNVLVRPVDVDAVRVLLARSN